MSQVTTGIRSILSSATVYRTFQGFMGGGGTARREFVRNFVRPTAGIHVLDIGCGPADILDYLPTDVNYWGFDISQPYIDAARSRHGTRGRFFPKALEAADLTTLPPMDLVVATGLFHHLDDATATALLQLIERALKPGGRLVTLDGVWEPGQNPIARWLISMDRGRHVRTKAGYEALFSAVFPRPNLTIRHRAWIPYTHCLVECTRPAGPAAPVKP